ncbi:MAG: TIGR00341 family protein, partial [Alphaproteobacteria bacterium]|nr:TIGR00341 family protein [Alphaproteobacteria bacterium]
MLEIVGDTQTLARCRNVLDQRRVTDVWQLTGAVHTHNEDGGAPPEADDIRPPDRGSLRALIQQGDQQGILDALSAVVSSDAKARIVLLPVDATEPEPALSEAEDFRQRISTPRQVLYSTIASGGKPTLSYYAYVVLATLVAAVGLLTDSVAVVIGAMVIAPLLGPLLALAFGSTLGDAALIRRSLMSASSGIGLALALSFGAGVLFPLDVETQEITSRLGVGLDGLLVAIASGAAGALAASRGTPGALVGVMVAVAILPPTTVVGLMLGQGRIMDAWGALQLL